MSDLLYCLLEVFGSDFDAESFSRDVATPDSTITKTAKGYPRSPIKAIRLGNVSRWKSPRKYFNRQEINCDNPFEAYLHEETFLIDFLKSFYFINQCIAQYKNDSTEVWLVAVYEVSSGEAPAGVHFGSELITALHEVGAAISTEVIPA